MLKIAVLGAGRMARGILQVVHDHDRCRASGVWVHDAAAISEFQSSYPLPTYVLVSDDLAAVLATADIAVDFTLAEANSAVIEQVLQAEVPLVCGVSGLDKAQIQVLSGAASRIPLLYDRNMSCGIALLTRLLRDAVAVLGDQYRVEIHESHHVGKKDAPSGTALLLGETVADVRGQKFADVYVYDPAGGEPEAPDSIRFLVSRKGDTPGDHRVSFRGSSETIELSHSVADRRVFAEGAVRAALWLVSRPAGLYRMSDVLAERAKSAGARSPA
jgi:4-hydroxy-tetrahydrodipicolinate reductase